MYAVEKINNDVRDTCALTIRNVMLCDVIYVILLAGT